MSKYEVDPDALRIYQAFRACHAAKMENLQRHWLNDQRVDFDSAPPQSDALLDDSGPRPYAFRYGVE